MLRVTTPATATPAAWTSAQVTSTLRPRLVKAVAADDARILEMVEELTREGERLATGNPGALWYQGYTERIAVQRLSKRLYLSARPVAAITSVKYDTEDALTEGTDPENFTVYPWGLYRENGWDIGEPGWSVVYLGGYWLPSMGSSPPATISDFVDATDFDRRAYHLRRALFGAMAFTWESDRGLQSVRSHGKSGRSIVHTGGEGGKPLFPGASAAVFLSEGASRWM